MRPSVVLFAAKPFHDLRLPDLGEPGWRVGGDGDVTEWWTGGGVVWSGMDSNGADSSIAPSSLSLIMTGVDDGSVGFENWKGSGRGLRRSTGGDGVLEGEAAGDARLAGLNETDSDGERDGPAADKSEGGCEGEGVRDSVRLRVPGEGDTGLCGLAVRDASSTGGSTRSSSASALIWSARLSDVSDGVDVRLNCGLRVTSCRSLVRVRSSEEGGNG